MTISNEYINLSTREKNAFTEAKMSNRVNLSYQEAVDNFRFIIDSDEKLRIAFQNFQELKDKEYINNAEIDILTAAFLDKYQKRIFFVINRRENEYLVYDFSSGNLTSMRDSMPDYLLMNKINYKFNEETTNKNIWRNAILNQFMFRSAVDPEYHRYGNNLFNITYYPINSLHLNDMGEPKINPIYVTIDPEDILSNRINFTKNARSA